MAVENLSATKRGVNNAAGHGLAGSVKCLSATVEVTAAATAASTYDFGDIPNGARILGISKLSYDDLASSGTPTVRLGLFSIGGNITSDDDALASSVNVYTAASSTTLPTNIDSYGKRAWEFVSGQTSAPQGNLKVKATLDADCNTGGTMTLELYYTVD